MDIRKDFLTEQWVCIAPLRSLRPFGTRPLGGLLVDDEAECPFCPQNRHITGEETCVVENARAVLNKYPALDAAGLGGHEVIIDSPDHHYAIINGRPEHLANTFRCIRQRVIHFSRDERIQAISVFKNHGEAAGASLPHAHWQIMALPFAPSVKRTMLANFKKHQAEAGRCYLCEMSEKLGDLTVFETDGVVAFCPHAALHYYGVNVMTKAHAPRFAALDDRELAGLAAAVLRALRALDAVLPGTAYNICFQCAPLNRVGRDEAGFWHFYMQIIPRLWRMAGFEMSTGCFINSMDPLEAAKRLRSAANSV